MHFITDHLHFITDHLHFITDHFYFITDHLHFITDHLHFITDHFYFNTDHSHFITDHLPRRCELNQKLGCHLKTVRRYEDMIYDEQATVVRVASSDCQTQTAPPLADTHAAVHNVGTLPFALPYAHPYAQSLDPNQSFTFHKLIVGNRDTEHSTSIPRGPDHSMNDVTSTPAFCSSSSPSFSFSSSCSSYAGLDKPSIAIPRGQANPQQQNIYSVNGWLWRMWRMRYSSVVYMYNIYNTYIPGYITLCNCIYIHCLII